MMPLLRLVLWSTLPLLAYLTDQDLCLSAVDNISQNVSPLLESLQCYNDYTSSVHCKWRKHGNTSLIVKDVYNSWIPCVPYDLPVKDENGTGQCRFEDRILTIGASHTAVFIKNEKLMRCSNDPQESLFQLLRVRPPVNLSTYESDDGGQQLSWSSPYPSTSSLNLTYQLCYRTDRQVNWTTVDVTNTTMKLEKHLLRMGHRYEAMVRAWATVGHWSDWSPVVTWETKEDTGQLPSLHCVLDGEKEVTCSWAVSRELANFFTYQLECQHNPTAGSCCVNQTVRSDPSQTMLTYSCSLTITDPAHMLLKLQQSHIAKVFPVHRHIQPNPPKQVNVTENGTNWIVKWDGPAESLKDILYYQVCYQRTQDQECSTRVDIKDESMSHTIPKSSLTQYQDYQVRIRARVKPGSGSEYDGIPSEWTDPVTWRSSAAPWSPTTLIYVFISVFVATVFFTLYYTIPACQRKVILWVDSVPSPGKSKTLSEFKCPKCRTLIESEDTSTFKVLHFNTTSTCSVRASLWPDMDAIKKHSELDDSFCESDNVLPPTEKVNSSDTSSMSFSGPYILCQKSEPNCKTVDVKCEENKKEKKILSDDSTSPVNIALYGEGYVCLPSCTISMSTQDLISHSDANTKTHRHNSTEQDQQRPDTQMGPDEKEVQPGLSEATGREPPPAYNLTPSALWPKCGTIQASGYCHLPQP